jgi:hypothetical protein
MTRLERNKKLNDEFWLKTGNYVQK